MNKKILCAVCTAAMLLSSCKNTEKPGKLAYEMPLTAMRFAASSGDGESYLSAWLPQEKQLYMSSDSYNEDFLKSIFDYEEFDGAMKVKVTESRELGESELEELETLAHGKYGTRLDFTKGMKLITEIRVWKNSELMTDKRELITVRYNNVWYLYGDMIEKFEFAVS
ncbi:MAG: hypothetical protein J6M17_10830 [Ruminococcus sp.]|nr:hypothetical protein [Ruminococcus sp.]